MKIKASKLTAMAVAVSLCSSMSALVSAQDFSRGDLSYMTPSEYDQRNDPVNGVGPVTTGSPQVYNEYKKNASLPPVTAYISNWAQYTRKFNVANIADHYDRVILSFFALCGTKVGDPSVTSSVTSTEQVCKDLRAQDFEVVTTDPWGDMGSTAAGALTGDDQAAAGNPHWETLDVLTQRWTQGENQVAGMLGAMKKLKAQHPDMVIGLSIGGWSLSEPFSRMAKDPAARKVFVDSIVQVFDNYSFFSQVDVDWEYPGGGGAEQNSSDPNDGENYKLLIQELRAALDKKHPKVSIAIAAPAPKDKALASNLKALVDSGVDTIHLMTYDFFGVPWAEQVNHHSNTFAHADSEWSVDTSVKYLINDLGVPAEAIHIGYANYSRNARGAELSSFSPLSGSYTMPNDGNYVGGSYEEGVYEWYDFEQSFATISEKDGMKLDKAEGYHLFTDKEANADFIYNKDKKFFMSMDTPRTAYLKARYAQKMGLGGIFNWMGDYDNGYMLNAVREGLGYDKTSRPENIDMEKIIFTCGENVGSAQECAQLTRLDTVVHDTQADAGGDITAMLEQGVSYFLDGSASTSAAGDLAYHWALAGSTGIAASSVQLKNADQAKASFIINDTSSAEKTVVLSFSLAVTDEKGVRSEDQVKFQLMAKNKPPVAIVTAVDPVVRGQSFTLDGSASYDPDGDDLSYKWKQMGGERIPLAGNGELPRFDVATTSLKNVDQMLAFELNVSDGVVEAGDSVQVQVRADVDNNLPPVPVIQTSGDLMVDRTVTLDGAKSTDDGEIASYRWAVSGPDGNVSVEGATGITATFVPKLEGMYQVALEVLDNLGVAGRSSTVIEITANNASCDYDPQSEQYEAWDPAKVYTGEAGDRVSYNGLVWEAKWWTQGDEPGVSDAWKLISDVTPEWSNEKAYQQNEIVRHKGFEWQALFWTQGEEPGVSSVWKKLGVSDC